MQASILFHPAKKPGVITLKSLVKPWAALTPQYGIVQRAAAL